MQKTPFCLPYILEPHLRDEMGFWEWTMIRDGGEGQRSAGNYR